MNIEINLRDSGATTELAALTELGHIDKLSILGDEVITTSISCYLKRVRSIRHLAIWTTMTRTALNDCLSIPNLAVLDLRDLTTPGKAIGVNNSPSLTTVRGSRFSEDDLHHFAQLPKLHELGAQSSDASPQVLNKLAQKPMLKHLDLEGAALDDTLIKILARSKTLTHLELCSANMTHLGLREIVSMQQLTGLDIWNTRITDADLSLLKQLPNLSYLAIGGHEGQTRLTAEGVMTEINKIASLKHLWVHNIHLTKSQTTILTDVYERFQYDFEEE